jgi:type II secretory pathway component PulF
VFSWSLFAWTEAMLIAWVGILVVVLPRLQDVFRDFKIQTPLLMNALVGVAKVVYYGGFIVVLAVPVGIGFLGGVLKPAARRALRMIVTLAVAGLIVITVLAIFQPLLTLIEGMSPAKK